MMHVLSVPGQIAGLNEYTKANRTHKMTAAKMKKDTEQYISLHIRQQLAGVKIDVPVSISIRWVEPNKKRDPDNVSFAKKMVLDSLVSNGVLQGDGWKHVTGFADTFSVDKDNPRVEVTIKLDDISAT